MSKKGFTIVELLIVVAIIAILTGILLMNNIIATMQKARDAKRKQDINKLARYFEDYLNDHNRYPPPDNPINGNISGFAWGAPFPPYMEEMPKDPLSPRQDYYYLSDLGTQKFYMLFARLERFDDPDAEKLSCKYGCGPNGAYNYYVQSGNIPVVGQNPGFQPGTLPTKPPPSAPTVPPSTACSLGGCGICDGCGNIGQIPYGSRCSYSGTEWYGKRDVVCQ